MSLEKANCLIRHGGGDWMPAERRGQSFFTPEGLLLPQPRAWKSATSAEIEAHLSKTNSVYIGDLK